MNEDVIIEVGGVRYQIKGTYPYMSREYQDYEGRPFWSTHVPDNEAGKLWSEIVRRLMEVENQ